MSMKAARMFRARDNRTLADPCFLAERFWERLMGLMGRAALAPGTGLLLRPCNSIHTFFMKFAIDALYLDSEGKVLAVRRALKPWRMTFPVARARQVLELPSGGAGDIAEGDLLCLN